jgi:hypothetical protein
MALILDQSKCVATFVRLRSFKFVAIFHQNQLFVPFVAFVLTLGSFQTF